MADSYPAVSGLYIKIRSLSVFPLFPAHRVIFCRRKGRLGTTGYSVVWCDDWEAELGASLKIIICFMSLHTQTDSETSSTFSSHLPWIWLYRLKLYVVLPSSVIWDKMAGKEVGQRVWSYPSLNLVSAFKPRVNWMLCLTLLSPGLTRPYACDWTAQRERQCSLWYHIKPGLAVLTYLPRLTFTLPLLQWTVLAIWTLVWPGWLFLDLLCSSMSAVGLH